LHSIHQHIPVQWGIIADHIGSRQTAVGNKKNKEQFKIYAAMTLLNGVQALLALAGEACTPTVSRIGRHLFVAQYFEI